MKNIFPILSIAFLISIGLYTHGQNENYLLMVVDVQEFENVKEEVPTEVYQSFLKEVNGVIELFEQEKVIYIKDMSLALSLTFKGKSIDTISCPDLDSHLNVVNNQVFAKNEGDSFSAHGLGEFLEKYPDHKMLVIGLMADVCIFNTLKSGCKQDYEMYIVPEAILAGSEKSKMNYLKKYKKKGVKTYNK